MAEPKLWCAERRIWSLGTSEEREAWLAARMTRLTASDLASVIGCGFRTRGEVMKEKLGLDNKDGKDDKVHGMAQVEAGRYMEPGLIRWFADQHLGATAECGELLFREGAHSFVAATPDALHCIDGGSDARQGEPLEVKCVGQDAQWNWGVATTPRKGWPSHLPLPVPDESNGNWALATNVIGKQWLNAAPGTWEHSVLQWRQHAVRRRTELLPLLGAPCAPLKYVVQLYVQMYVLKRTEGMVTACIGGENRLDLHYTMHPPTMHWLLEQARDFWAELQDRRI